MERETIATRLVRARGDLTRKAVCQALGISEQALYAYETGRRIPRDDVKRAMAKLYGTTVESLFFAQELYR